MRMMILGVVGSAGFLLISVSVPPPTGIDLGRIFFWTAITLALGAIPVRLPGGIVAFTTTAPLVAAVFDRVLPNPFALCWIAVLGTIELRDVRHQLPFWGTLYNRSDFLLSTFAAYAAVRLTDSYVRDGDPLGAVAQIAIAGVAFSLVNLLLGVSVASLRT
ncbi:MAG: hypothetical protein E6J27_03405, partial [Chloroflexi bacterium]